MDIEEGDYGVVWGAGFPGSREYCTRLGCTSNAERPLVPSVGPVLFATYSPTHRSMRLWFHSRRRRRRHRAGGQVVPPSTTS